MQRANRLRELVVDLYRGGYPPNEIGGFEFQEEGKDPVRRKIPQGTLSRWLSWARDQDPDLIIHHHLNRRKWSPGVYTHWEAKGKVILGPFYDPLRRHMILGAGMTYEPLDPTEQITRVMSPQDIQAEQQLHEQQLPRSVAAAAILKVDFGYSFRDIEQLSKGKSTRFPEKDRIPAVRRLAERLEPASYSTLRRAI